MTPKEQISLLGSISKLANMCGGVFVDDLEFDGQWYSCKSVWLNDRGRRERVYVGKIGDEFHVMTGNHRECFSTTFQAAACFRDVVINQPEVEEVLYD